MVPLEWVHGSPKTPRCTFWEPLLYYIFKLTRGTVVLTIAPTIQIRIKSYGDDLFLSKQSTLTFYFPFPAPHMS